MAHISHIGPFCHLRAEPNQFVLHYRRGKLVRSRAGLAYWFSRLSAGVNPDPERYDGVLCPHPPRAVSSLLDFMERREGAFRVQGRTMVMPEREDGQRLALNEVFVGHRTHQSARYRIRAGGREERGHGLGSLHQP